MMSMILSKEERAALVEALEKGPVPKELDKKFERLGFSDGRGLLVPSSYSTLLPAGRIAAELIKENEAKEHSLSRPKSRSRSGGAVMNINSLSKEEREAALDDIRASLAGAPDRILIQVAAMMRQAAADQEWHNTMSRLLWSQMCHTEGSAGE